MCSPSLQLIHSSVVDTAIVFPHRLGLPYKRALKNLMADHLKRIIQDNGEEIAWAQLQQCPAHQKLFVSTILFYSDLDDGRHRSLLYKNPDEALNWNVIFLNYEILEKVLSSE